MRTNRSPRAPANTGRGEMSDKERSNAGIDVINYPAIIHLLPGDYTVISTTFLAYNSRALGPKHRVEWLLIAVCLTSRWKKHRGIFHGQFG